MTAMRPLVLALALCACKPPPPEPTPAASAAAPTTTPPADSPAAPPAAEPPPAQEERCKCPAEPAPGEAVADEPAEAAFDEEDPDAKQRRERATKKLPKPLAARLSAALPDVRAACDVALSGPCSLRGDFDGDGAPDDAVLVRGSSGAGGIALLWGTGAAELLGGGRRGACWTTTEVVDLDGTSDVEPCAEEIDADIAWIARWELRPRRLRDGRPVVTGKIGRRTVESPTPGAVGDALYLSGGDAAAVLYRAATGWILMHLGY